MKVAYIAGPYRGRTIHDTVENIRRAEKVAIKYWQKGYAVICPHKNTALFDGLCVENVWLKGDIEIMKRCDVIVMMKNWKDSEGARKEYEIAVSLEKKIILDI